MRRGFEAYQSKANEPADTVPAGDLAEEGRKLIEQICKEYKLDPYYQSPQMFGPRMVIWLPGNAWDRLTPAQQSSIIAYMSSKYKNWGIGVGRVNGPDVMADRLVVEH
jgi:hypothetical protein